MTIDETQKKVIEEALDTFDFVRVRELMEHLGWTWYDHGTPSIYQLMKKAEELLQEACLLQQQDGQWSETGRGGLYASCDNAGNVTLRFVLTEAYVNRQAFEKSKESTT